MSSEGSKAKGALRTRLRADGEKIFDYSSYVHAHLVFALYEGIVGMKKEYEELSSSPHEDRKHASNCCGSSFRIPYLFFFSLLRKTL